MFSILLAFKNVVSRKSSFVIILFIAFAIALLTVSNAVFDGTGSGIQTTFINSFTGDIIVRPYTNYPLSLFGDETPSTGEYSEIPALIPYHGVYDEIQNSGLTVACVPQLTGLASLNAGDEHIEVILFGVDGIPYMSMMNGIHILQGAPYSEGEKGLMLSTAMIDMIEEESDVRLSVGDEVQFAGSDGSTFAMRSVTLTAIYEYPARNNLLDRIALISPNVLRELCGMTSSSAVLGNDIDYLKQNLLNDDISIDDLFSDTESSDTQIIDDVKDGIEDSPPDTADIAENSAGDTTWNYIVCKVKQKISPSVAIKILNRRFTKNNWPVRAANWRAAAGMSAMYLYWMRLIFNVGIIVILGTGFIVVNNTLVISAIDRTVETGTMRALGADRAFVGVQFLLETLMLTATAGIFGVALGFIGTHILSSVHIMFTNSYLIQLFGGNTLKIAITRTNLIQCFSLSVLLAVIGWIYPSRIALSVSPVESMQRVR